MAVPVGVGAAVHLEEFGHNDRLSRIIQVNLSNLAGVPSIVYGILGLTAMISPISVAPRFLTFDLPIMIAVSFVLVGLLLTRPQIGRAVGGLMLLGYVGYVIAA